MKRHPDTEFVIREWPCTKLVTVYIHEPTETWTKNFKNRDQAEIWIDQRKEHEKPV